MMWLFHFRIAGELGKDSKQAAHGIGHAKRCITLINYLTHELDINSCVVTNNVDVVKQIMDNLKVPVYPEVELKKVLTKEKHTIIISDINYLEKEIMEIYRQHGSWVCLAPRGQSKYHADIAFKDVFFDDEQPPPEGIFGKIYCGPKYVVTNDEYKNVRINLLSGNLIKKDKTIVIAMGGIDIEDVTGFVLNRLCDLPANWTINIITGPLYPHIDILQMAIGKMNCKVNFYNNPKAIYNIIAESSIGIFNAGITAYEAIGLGTPSLNISQTLFHEKRSIELEKMGTGVHLGHMKTINQEMLKKHVFYYLRNEDALKKMKNKCFNIVDDRGVIRIVEAIDKCLRKADY